MIDTVAQEKLFNAIKPMLEGKNLNDLLAVFGQLTAQIIRQGTPDVEAGRRRLMGSGFKGYLPIDGYVAFVVKNLDAAYGPVKLALSTAEVNEALARLVRDNP